VFWRATQSYYNTRVPKDIFILGIKSKKKQNTNKSNKRKRLKKMRKNPYIIWLFGQSR